MRDYNRREAYIKRTAIVKRQKSMLIVLFLIALLSSLFVLSSNTYAGNFKENNSESIKMFKSVTIYYGDTLESIAEEYMSNEYSSESAYIKELISINSISATATLVPGNSIIVPYYTNKSFDSNITNKIDPVIVITSSK